MTLTDDRTTASLLGWPMPAVQGLAVAEPASEPPAAAPPRRTVLLAVVALLAVLAAALAITQTLRLHDRSSSAADERAALSAARTIAVALDSYDYQDLDVSFRAVLAGATDPFKGQYASTSEKLKELLVQYKAKASSEVVAAGVASHSGDTVTVVLFVDQTVTNANTPQSRVDRNRLQLTMRKVHGRFLVADAQLL